MQHAARAAAARCRLALLPTQQHPHPTHAPTAPHRPLLVPQGCSYSVERCWVVTRSGAAVDLSPNLEGLPGAAPTFTPSHMERIVTRSAGAGGRQRQVQVRRCAPWGAWEQCVGAGRGSSAGRVPEGCQRAAGTGATGAVTSLGLPIQTCTLCAPQEVTVMFNLVNEPWPKYNSQARSWQGS